MMERYDAVLAHVYMYSPENKKGLKSSIRGRMQVSALAYLYGEGRIGKIFIAGGKVWGDDYPSLAEVMREELQRRSVNPEDIIINPQAKDTPAEIDLFLEETRKRGWGKIASIANHSHQLRIRKIYERRNKAVDHISAENTLYNIDDHYQEFIKKFRMSKMEVLFIAREAIITVLYMLGLEEKLTKFAQSSRVQKFKVPFDS